MKPQHDERFIQYYPNNPGKYKIELVDSGFVFDLLKIHSKK